MSKRIRFARGGVAITSALNGTTTVDLRFCFSPLPGGDSTVRVIVPSATPLSDAAESLTRTYTPRWPVHGLRGVQRRGE